MFCAEINSFPGSSVAAAAGICQGRFRFKWDTEKGTVLPDAPHRADVWGSGGIVIHIIDLGTRG